MIFLIYSTYQEQSSELIERRLVIHQTICIRMDFGPQRIHHEPGVNLETYRQEHDFPIRKLKKKNVML
jgi:hypothetical protein